MEASSNLHERELDFIIHSPGGSAEAAESLVEYLRQRFDHVRVFIPVAAMSAATMMALSADELVMGQHSQLGPIDPQFIISTPEGPRSAPARAILNQFELAKRECQEPGNLAAWMPILRTYAPGLLTQCEASQTLAINMVGGWLERYMMAGEPDASEKSKVVADWFANFEMFGSHGRRVGRNQAREIGVKVVDLENDHNLQDAVLSVHHATMHTFAGTPAQKIIENHHGRAWVRMGGALSRPNEIALPPSESARCTPRRTTPSAKGKPRTEVRPQSPDEREHCKAVALLAIAPFVTISTTSAPPFKILPESRNSSPANVLRDDKQPNV